MRLSGAQVNKLCSGLGIHKQASMGRLKKYPCDFGFVLLRRSRSQLSCLVHVRTFGSSLTSLTKSCKLRATAGTSIRSTKQLNICLNHGTSHYTCESSILNLFTAFCTKNCHLRLRMTTYRRMGTLYFSATSCTTHVSFIRQVMSLFQFRDRF